MVLIPHVRDPDGKYVSFCEFFCFAELLPGQFEWHSVNEVCRKNCGLGDKPVERTPPSVRIELTLSRPEVGILGQFRYERESKIRRRLPALNPDDPSPKRWSSFRNSFHWAIPMRRNSYLLRM